MNAMQDSTEVAPLLKHQDETAGGLMTSASIVLNRRHDRQNGHLALAEIITGR